ncbi:MAG: M20/M25/M40 family metallo-hydrolase [Nitrosopumilaceae archaeon]|nr:M20/M25/M40 family metallo-hydrolase [Nitrosopumilaceae archaeon]
MREGFSVTPKYAVKMLEKALRLYTPSLEERSMTEFLAEKCDELGFHDIRIDGVGNVIAKKGSGTPVVMLCGHMDTVPGKIRVRRDGDLLYGRGASDAKAPLMAMLFAAASVRDGNGTIIFVGVVDEEGNATGIKNLVKKRMDVDYAVFGEPSRLDHITIGYKGRLAISLRIDVKSSAHASAPWLAKNAIEEAALFTGRLKESLEARGGDNRTKQITAALTEIRGGSSHNVTPQECTATMDIRIPTTTSCKMIEEKISDLVREISEERGVEAFYSILDETEPFEASARSPLVRAFNLGILEVERTHAIPIRKTGTGDMNVMGSRWNIPVVTYGPGDPHASHTVNECVSVSEYLRGIEVLKRTLGHIKRLHDKRAKT